MAPPPARRASESRRASWRRACRRHRRPPRHRCLRQSMRAALANTLRRRGAGSGHDKSRPLRGRRRLGRSVRGNRYCACGHSRNSRASCPFHGRGLDRPTPSAAGPTCSCRRRRRSGWRHNAPAPRPPCRRSRPAIAPVSPACCCGNRMRPMRLRAALHRGRRLLRHRSERTTHRRRRARAAAALAQRGDGLIAARGETGHDGEVAHGERLHVRARCPKPVSIRRPDLRRRADRQLYEPCRRQHGRNAAPGRPARAAFRQWRLCHE